MVDKKRNLPENCAITLWAVPRKVRHAFKIKCAEKSVSMKQTIIDFMIKFSK